MQTDKFIKDLKRNKIELGDIIDYEKQADKLRRAIYAAGHNGLIDKPLQFKLTKTINSMEKNFEADVRSAQSQALKASKRWTWAEMRTRKDMAADMVTNNFVEKYNHLIDAIVYSVKVS